MNLWECTGPLRGVRVRDYLWEQKWLKAICITKAHGSIGGSSLKPGANWTVLEGSSAGWRVPCPGWVSSRQFSWSLLLPGSLAHLSLPSGLTNLRVSSSPYYTSMLREEGSLVYLVIFRDFLKPLSCSLADPRDSAVFNVSPCFEHPLS